jgi:hypothetical protein
MNSEQAQPILTHRVSAHLALCQIMTFFFSNILVEESGAVQVV